MSRQTAIDQPIRCGACGHVARRWLWQPGATCPLCGSDRFAPMVSPEGAYDYELADRSEGPAAEDHRVGRLARWAGLISVNQLADVARELRQVAASGMSVRPIGDVLVERKLIRKRQLSALLRVLAAPREKQEERLFCDVAVGNGFVSAEQAADALDLQKRLVQEGYQAPFIGFLLIEKRLLSDKQVCAILKASGRRGKGILADVDRALAEGEQLDAESVPVATKTRRWRRSPLVAAIVLFVTVVVAIRMAVVFGGPSAAVRPVTVVCEKCGRLRNLKLGVLPPCDCPECDGKAWLAYACGDCRRVFAMKESRPTHHGVCPGCKSANVAPVAKKAPAP